MKKWLPADEIEVDQMGNLYARRGRQRIESSNRRSHGRNWPHRHAYYRRRICALHQPGIHHSTYVDGSRVRFADGTLGVVSRDKARFVADMDKMPGVDQHFIDVGASSRDNCPVKIGTPGVIWQTMEVQGSRWIARCHDDRIGCDRRRGTQTPA